MKRNELRLSAITG